MAWNLSVLHSTNWMQMEFVFVTSVAWRVAMLRVLFDFVVDTRSNPPAAGISDSRPSQKTRRTGHPTVLVMPARSRALGHPALEPVRLSGGFDPHSHRPCSAE